MKLSEKYFSLLISDFGAGTVDSIEKELQLYAEICSLEGKKEFLVKNQAIIKNEHYIDLLAEIVNALQEIAEKENL